MSGPDTLQSPLRSFSVDELHVCMFRDRNAMGAAAADDCASAIRRVLAEKSHCRIVFAAAPSQNEVLSGLVSAPGIDWTRVHAFHMDEYVGLPSGDPRRFGEFLRNAIFSRLPFGRIEYLVRSPIQSGAEAGTEAERYAALLSEAPIDIVCLGIGENGHIAFNDPSNADFSDPRAVKEVELDQECRLQQVHDLCFASLDEVPKTALTLTIPTLVSGMELFCVVPGPTKANAVRDMLEGPMSTACPATALRAHGACTLYLDADSAGSLR